jgi:hypothetical protein
MNRPAAIAAGIACLPEVCKTGKVGGRSGYEEWLLPAIRAGLCGSPAGTNEPLKYPGRVRTGTLIFTRNGGNWAQTRLGQDGPTGQTGHRSDSGRRGQRRPRRRIARRSIHADAGYNGTATGGHNEPVQANPFAHCPPRRSGPRWLPTIPSTPRPIPLGPRLTTPTSKRNGAFPNRQLKDANHHSITPPRLPATIISASRET